MLKLYIFKYNNPLTFTSFNYLQTKNDIERHICECVPQLFTVSFLECVVVEKIPV